MKKTAWLVCLLVCLRTNAQQRNAGVQMADAAISAFNDSSSISSGRTDAAKISILLLSLEAVWDATGNGKYFSYINKTADQLVHTDGSLKLLPAGDASAAAQILLAYEVTKKDRYRKAAETIFRSTINLPPGNTAAIKVAEALAFNAAYTSLFQLDSLYPAILAGFRSLQQRTLTYEERPLLSLSLLYALDKIPTDKKIWKDLLTMLQADAKKLRLAQDTATGKWPAAGKTDEAGEYATTALIAYIFAKGARLGYVEAEYARLSRKSYDYIQQQFRGAKTTTGRGEKGSTDPGPGNAVPSKGSKTSNGRVRPKPANQVAEDKKTGTNDRETTTAKTAGRRISSLRESFMNDPARVGSFILLATEIEKQETAAVGKGKKVLLDYYYNNEWQKNAFGKEERWHYTLEDRSNSGYHMLGEIFRAQGATITSLQGSAADLTRQQVSMYIIVDPDTEKETPDPHFLLKEDIRYIKQWVDAGGVLLLMGNDKGNAEFTHLNELAAEFGLRFNEDKQNTVIDDTFEQGVVMTPAGSRVFGEKTRKLFIKEFSSLDVKAPAETVLAKGDINVMAVAASGKGFVVALGDPWIYNEYIDGRKLTPDFENYPATMEWVKWMLGLAKKSPVEIESPVQKTN
ncbi:MAG: hypothetical protein EOO09_02195 [Chitinophagaceae bacterium]|nr:MAG: hypothetical protein EOO09_02195 [Chitinophagaceae bacterium]